jgi:hypothetical protein
VDGKSTNTPSGEELAILRELEACDVRLRLHACLEGETRGNGLVGELQARRDEAEQLLNKLRAKGRRRKRASAAKSRISRPTPATDAA